MSNLSYSLETLQLGQNWRLFVPCDLEIWWMTLKNNSWIGHLFYTTLSFVQHFKAIGIFKLELQSGNAQFGSNWQFFVPCDIQNWRMTLKNNSAPPLCYIKLCASFPIHGWSQTWVTVRKRSIWVKIGDFFVPRDLEISWMTLKNNRASLLYYIKLCAAFQSHWCIQTWVKVRKRPKFSHVTLKFVGWPWKTIGHFF